MLDNRGVGLQRFHCNILCGLGYCMHLCVCTVTSGLAKTGLKLSENDINPTLCSESPSLSCIQFHIPNLSDI